MMFTEEQREEFWALGQVKAHVLKNERSMDVDNIIEAAFDAGREFEKRRLCKKK